jgi:hypothetical protein
MLTQNGVGINGFALTKYVDKIHKQKGIATVFATPCKNIKKVPAYSTASQHPKYSRINQE